MSQPNGLTILGVHEGHNAAGALLRKGKIVAAVQEERLTRRKNQSGIPYRSIDAILADEGSRRHAIDKIALNGTYMTYDSWDPNALLNAFGQSGTWGKQITSSLIAPASLSRGPICSRTTVSIQSF